MIDDQHSMQMNTINPVLRREVNAKIAYSDIPPRSHPTANRRNSTTAFHATANIPVIPTGPCEGPATGDSRQFRAVAGTAGTGTAEVLTE